MRVPPLPQPAEAGSPPLRGGDCFVKEKWGGDVQRSCDVRACVAQDKRTHSRRRPRTQSKPQRRSQPKRAPAAKPPQQHPAGQTHPRKSKATHPAQSQAAQPTQTRTGGEAAAATPGRSNAPTQVKGHAPSSSPRGTANPNAHRRPKPPQLHQAGQTHPRKSKDAHPAQAPAAQPTQTRAGGRAAAATPGRSNAPTQVKGHAPSPSPSSTANPNAHRRPKPPQQHPAGQTHQRETKGPGVRVRQDNPTHAGPRAPTTRTRQRRAALAAQTAVGDAQERILFRDDHVANTANVRLRRTKQKALFFGGIPVSFGKTKEMGYKYTELTKHFPPARKVHSRGYRIGHRRQELHRV